ncbi:MAG: VgrG-related protein [Anaerolineaceae bacterium]|nr:VgrG-related protein [Anaerolineaceae bacterium]
MNIKIGGRLLSSQVMDDLIELVVDTDYFLPAMFSIRLRDRYDDSANKLSYADQDTYKVGAEVEISITALDEDLSKSLIQGEITTLEQNFAPDGNAYFTIRGYDRSHRLMNGKKTRVFGSGAQGSIAEEDILHQIAQQHGLSAMVDSTGLRYAYVLQYNQSDWDFLWDRARLIGNQLYAEGRALHYHPVSKERGAGLLELKWGENLTSFQPRVTLMGRISKSVSIAMNDQKTAVQGMAQKAKPGLAPSIGLGKEGGTSLKQAFGEAQGYVAAPGSAVQAQVDAYAAADMLDSENGFVQGDGFCRIGEPGVLAGRKVRITNVGKRFEGTYYITKAVHEWRNGLYSVHFSVSGNCPHTVRGLLQPGDDGGGERIYGMVRAVVTSVSDPDKLGRVRAKFPWMPDGDHFESNWMRFASPGAGSDRGLLFSPEVNDEVLVAFEHGDPSSPYVVGALWNKKDLPPKGSQEIIAAGKVTQRVIRSRSGHLIILNDKEGEEQIVIQDKSQQNSFIIDSAKGSITIKSKGDFIIEAGGKFTVKSQGDASIDSKANSAITCQQAFSVDAKKEAVLKAIRGQLTLKPDGTQLAGTKVDVKSDTMASLSGNAVVELKGAIVKIN